MAGLANAVDSEIKASHVTLDNDLDVKSTLVVEIRGRIDYVAIVLGLVTR